MTIRLLPLALLAVASLAPADRTLVYRYEIAGTPSGESRVTIKDDGTFSGTTTANLGQKIEVVYSGRTRGALIPKWDMAITVAARPAHVVADGETVQVESAGKTLPLPNGALPTKLASLTPFFNRTVLPSLPASVAPDRPAPPFDALLLDNFSKVPATVLERGARTLGGHALRTARLKVGPLEINLAWDEAGECVGFEVPVQSYRIVAEGYEGVFASPLDAFPELSRPVYDIERATVQVPMRDGVTLATELLRPKSKDGTDSAKVPTILVRTPYGREPQTLAYGWLVRRGYAVMVQDCRGRGASGGEWDPFVNESADGDDTLNWIAAQPWSDGGAGSIGGSYAGFVQWATAVGQNPILKCIVPQVSPPGSAMTNLPYVYGVPTLFSGLWWLRIVEGKDADMSAATQGMAGAAKLATLPLSGVDEAVFGHEMPLWDRWMARDRASAWKGWNFQTGIGATTVPALHVSGYWDGDEIGTMLNWESRANAGHDAQWLIYGPWPHGFNASTTFGGIDFGKESVLDLDSVYLRFFDTYLK